MTEEVTSDKIVEQPIKEEAVQSAETAPEAEKSDKDTKESAQTAVPTESANPVDTESSAPQDVTTEEVMATQGKYADLKPGMTVKVYQKIKETNTKGEEKERIQIFEGIILARKHGQEAGATITVHKDARGIGVEKIFPLNSPFIEKIEVVKEARVRRSKLYFLRNWKKRLREKAVS